MAHSEEYKQVLRTTREQRPKWGSSSPVVRDLRVLLRRKGTTILDYGCGTGSLKKAMPAPFEVTNYDPSVPEYSTLPDGQFDAVVARHVLEHIEPEYLDATLVEIRDRVRHVAVLTIPHHLAGTTLSDGRNAHLIVEGKDWWLQRLKNIFPVEQWSHTAASAAPNIILCTTFIIRKIK